MKCILQQKDGVRGWSLVPSRSALSCASSLPPLDGGLQFDKKVIVDTICNSFCNKRMVYGVGALYPLDPRLAARPLFTSMLEVEEAYALTKKASIEVI